MSILQGTCSYCGVTGPLTGPVDYRLCEGCNDDFCFKSDGPYQEYLSMYHKGLLSNDNTEDELLQEDEDDTAELLASLDRLSRNRCFKCGLKFCGCLKFCLPLECLTKFSIWVVNLIL